MRTAAEDRALCLHEAAHAVTAEALRPGCVLGIEMDYVPGTPTFHGVVHGDNVQAVCGWKLWYYDDPAMLVAVAAGREGERIEEYGDRFRFDGGDRELLKTVATPRQRVRARRRAAALVRKHELAIRRLAKALAERRTMTGDEIRAVIA